MMRKKNKRNNDKHTHRCFRHLEKDFLAIIKKKRKEKKLTTTIDEFILQANFHQLNTSAINVFHNIYIDFQSEQEKCLLLTILSMRRTSLQ